MVYLVIGIALIVIALVLYVVYRRRWRGRPARRHEEPPSDNPGPGDTTAEMPKPRPVVSEVSSLPEADRKKFMAAVWYRCENPGCNHSKFLDMHHIVSEVEGGGHSLNNLIVLCSACHTAVQNGEISHEQIKSWVREPAERFKENLDWKYS